MKLIFTFFIIIVLLITGSVYGQLATYTGTGGTSTAVTGYANETVSILQDAGFGSNTACGSGGLSGKTVNTVWGAYSTAGPRYYIKITPNAGYQLNMTGMNAGLRRSNTGPTLARFAYSLDNGVTWIDDGTNHPNTSTTCGVSSPVASWGAGALPTGITNTVNGIIVAIFPYAPGGSTGTFQTNYINILGTVTPGCTPPVVAVTPAAPSFCAGSGGTTLTASGAGATGTYSWTPSTGLSASTGATVTANPATTTTYTVTGYTSASCSGTQVITVTVNPLPAAGAIVGADSVCAGANILLTNPTATAGGTWTSSLPSVASISGTTVHGVSPGTTSIQYSVTTVCGTVTTLHNVTVNPLPNAGSISGSDSVCFGTTITLADPATGGTWGSAAPGIATVSGGVVTGLSPVLATTNITYTSYTFSCGTAVATHPVTVKPQPFAGTITGTTTLCKLDVTTLSASGPGGSWSSSVGSVAAITGSGIVTALSAGSAIITYSVTNSCGTATDTALVQVNDLPPAITGSSLICAGVTTVLHDSLPAGNWSSNNTSVATIDASGTVYGIAPGTATITYANSVTNCYVTIPVVVNLSLPPSITIGTSPATSVCAGTTVTYTANPVNGGTSPLLVWSVNGVIISGAPTYTYTPLDGDVIRCWFISSLGCAVPDTASTTVTMTVHHIATPALSMTTGMGDTVCTGSTTTITAIPVDGGTAPVYSWFVNLAPAGTGSSISYTPANGDIIRCIMTSNQFCRTVDTASASKILTVSPYLDPSVNMLSSLGPTTCEGYPVTFTASPVNGGTAPGYQWAVNNTPTATGTTYTYTPANGDMVAVTLTSNFPCVTTPTVTNTMLMTVVPIIQPIGTVTARPGEIIPFGANDTFLVHVVSGGGLAPTFQWFKNSVPVPGATNTIYVTNSLHTGDSISCQVTNNDLCSGVSVFNSAHVTIDNNVGVQDMAGEHDNNYRLFPNPNAGSFMFSGNGEGVITYQVVDMLGKVMTTGDFGSTSGKFEQQIDLSNKLSAGQYLLRVITANETQNIHFVISK